MIPAQTKYALFGAFEIARRRKWPALLLFLFSFSAVASVITFLPNVYKSQATLLVEEQQVPESYIRSTVTSAVDRRVQGITQTLLSRSRLSELIDRFNLYPDMRGVLTQEQLVERMQREIQVKLTGANRPNNKGGLVAFTISYVGRDSQKVAGVVNELASLYIEEDLKVRERQAAGTAEFLKSQLETMKVKLDEQERLVKDFKENYLGELPQQEAANLSTLERLNGQLLLNQEKQIRTREDRALVEKQLAEAGLSATNAPDAMAARLAQLEVDLYQLRQRFTDKYPDVIQVKAEIAELERQLEQSRSGEAAEDGTPSVSATTGAAAPPPVTGAAAPPATANRFVTSIRQLDIDLRALEREEQLLKERIAEYQGRVENTPRRAQEFQALQRDYDTTLNLYETLLRRYEEAKLAESLENRQKGEQFRILDAAIAHAKPNAPNRTTLYLIGLVVSLIAAIAAVAVAELFDTSFHGVDELRAFSRIPILATVQQIRTEADRQLEARRFRLAAISTAVGLVVVVTGSYVVAQDNTWLSAFFS